MLRFQTVLWIGCCCAAAVCAAEPEKLDDALQQLSVESEAVVVARISSQASLPKESNGSFALWIVRSIKGRLRGGRDIIWVGQKDLPGAEVGPQLWLLFLQRGSQSDWHTKVGANNAGLVKIPDLRAPVLLSTIHFIGNHGEPPDYAEELSDADLKGWMEQAANGSRDGSHEGLAKLAEQGPFVIPILQKYEAQPERSVSAAARTLLSLVVSGPPVNGLRLALHPGTIEFHDGERHVINANLANITSKEMNVVTGVTLTGESLRAVTAFDVFRADAKGHLSGPALKTVFTPSASATENPKSSALPITHTVAAFSVLPLALELNLECKKDAGKTSIRLNFPQGYVDLPEFGSYMIRAHFDCPGPRLDQQRLVDENYWGGGQLISNEILISVSENQPPVDR